MRLVNFPYSRQFVKSPCYSWINPTRIESVYLMWHNGKYHVAVDLIGNTDPDIPSQISEGYEDQKSAEVVMAAFVNGVNEALEH